MIARKLYQTLLLLIFAITSVHAQWIEVPSGTTLDLNDVWFTDSLNGWIAADNGMALYTNDGGTSWNKVGIDTLNHYNLLSVEFKSIDTGWIVPEWGLPWITADAGATWKQDMAFDPWMCFGVESSISPGAEHFLQKGCFGESGIFTRTDTGLAYTFIVHPSSFEYGQLTSIVANSPTTAVAMGDNNLQYITLNRGASWTLTSTVDTFIDYNDVAFQDSLHGWAVTNDTWWPLRKTDDGGMTWAIDSTWDATFFYPVMHCIELNGPAQIFTGGSVQWGGGIIFETGVPGWWADWYYEGVRSPVRAIHFSAESMAFAVGDTGMIVRKDSIILNNAKPTIGPGESIGLSLWPNPASEDVNITLSLPESGETNLRLLDINGRECRKITFLATREFETKMNLTALPAGIYLLEVTHQENKVVKKLVIE